MKVKSLSRVRLLGTPWTVAYQAPPSMGFSRQEPVLCWTVQEGGTFMMVYLSAYLDSKGIKVDLELFSGEGDGTPLQYSCLESPMDGGAW